MYNMKGFFAAVLIFAAFATLSGKPHIRKSPHGHPHYFDDGPGPHGNPPILDDQSEDDELVTIGDMTLPKRMMKTKKGSNREKRQALMDGDADYKWPKANSLVTVPYTVGSGIDTEVLQRAIEVFNAKTCVRFVPRDSQSNYVKFKIANTCNAAVGYQEVGKQDCKLTSGCAGKKGKVLHEMMHILSFLHEQCRPDRDSYVTVHMDRIKSGMSGNFNKITGKDLSIPYDCDSILHYKSTAFAATSGQETITSSHCSHLGNGDTRLSLKDYKRVNTLYSCGKPEYKYYTVVVVTDSTTLSGAGTDCFIYLTLHSSAHTSTEFELDLSTNPDANLFETGSTDTFNYMAYRNDLGSITGISVRMVAHGSGQAWWPNTFTVTDPATSTSVTFTNNKWLSPSSTYGTSNFPTQ